MISGTLPGVGVANSLIESKQRDSNHSRQGLDRFAQNRVVKVARFEFSDGTAVRASFTRQRDMQFVPLGGVRTRWVRIVIEQTYPPQLERNPRDFTPISEVQVQGIP